MPTDVHKLNLDDLMGRLFYATVNKEWPEIDAIRAEIARRIEVRDRVVKHLMDMDYSGAAVLSDGTTVRRDADDDTLTYSLNGDQIL